MLLLFDCWVLNLSRSPFVNVFIPDYNNPTGARGLDFRLNPPFLDPYKFTCTLYFANKISSLDVFLFQCIKQIQEMTVIKKVSSLHV